MDTNLKRQVSEVEAELKLALDEACQETGTTWSSSSLATKALFLKAEHADSPVTVERLARWFIATRTIRSRSRSRSISSEQKTVDECSSQKATESTLSARERLQNAAALDINSSDFSWENLVCVYGTEHTTSDSGSASQDKEPAALEVTVNSGGVVYFAMFNNGNQEGAACIKFTPSRLATQSERLGFELARHLGVSTPQARIIRSGTDEWEKIIQATEKVKSMASSSGNVEGEKTCGEMLEALQLSRCLLLMGYVNGVSFLDCGAAFSTQAAAERTAAALGRVFLLDLVLRNEDRLACHQLGWRGNAGNLLCSEKKPIVDAPRKWNIELQLPKPLPLHARGKQALQAKSESDLHLVAIDSGVPRRPPGHKRDFDKEHIAKLVETVLNDLDTAFEVLREISGGNLAAHNKDSSGDIDQVRVVNAFRLGFRVGLKDLHTLRTFLWKLQRRLDYHMKQFVADIGEKLPSDWSPSKSSPGSISSPTTLSSDHASPQSKLERRFTLQLRDFNKLAKVDDGIHDSVEHWDDVMHSEGCKLSQAHDFVTGFLEGGGGKHNVVDSYELKIRLEHILERVELISLGCETERPSQVLESLYVGGVLAAKSYHTLHSIGITHILCMCPIEAGQPEADVLQTFTYKSCQVLDIAEEDIARHFEDTCSFIESAEQAGGKILVHCFEGKSRSATIVLAYLVRNKGQTLLEAWTRLKASHPRSQPNDGFMRTLSELEKRIHGKNSLDWQQRRPSARICPVCSKNVGVSSESLKVHLQRAHQL